MIFEFINKNFKLRQTLARYNVTKLYKILSFTILAQHLNNGKLYWKIEFDIDYIVLIVLI